VHGDRRIIAHVGATLVRRGAVPTDLSVQIPDLEDALLGLLDGDSAAAAVISEQRELVGGRR
jgi:hypothetical protein